MLLGGIQLSKKLEGFKIVNHSASQLPQDLATGFDKINLPDVNYEPLWYIGNKDEHTHLLICKQTRGDLMRIVALVIDVDAEFNPSIIEVIDDADIVEGAQISDNIKAYFLDALKGLLGVSYSPILYIGSQVVKGVNFYIVTDAKLLYPNADPYPSLITINVFNGNAALVGIEPLK